METNCKECGVELHGLKKMFCSRKCKDDYKNKHRTPEQKERYKTHNREMYKLKREERLKQKAEYYQENREEIIRKNTKYKTEHPEADKRYGRTLKGRYRDYKNGANCRGHEFKLTIEDFEKLWNKNCYYCGDLIDGIGIDRVDNNVGYLVGNVVPCCPVCNKMKLTLRSSDFTEQCIKISNNLNK